MLAYNTPITTRNRYAIGLADQSKPSPGCAGWDRFAITYYNILLR